MTFDYIQYWMGDLNNWIRQQSPRKLLWCHGVYVNLYCKLEPQAMNVEVISTYITLAVIFLLMAFSTMTAKDCTGQILFMIWA